MTYSIVQCYILTPFNQFFGFFLKYNIIVWKDKEL